MSEHSQEPWINDVYGFVGSNTGCIADLRVYHNRRENARRIVACVNACAGMDDPAAEIARLRAEVEKMHDIAISVYHTMEYDEDMSAVSEMRTAKFSDRLKAAIAATEKEIP